MLKLMTSLALVLVFLSCAAHADQNLYVRALGGVGAVNNSGGTNFTYGLGVGYKFVPQFGAGVDYTYNTFTVPSPLTANLSLVLAHLKYYFIDLGLSAGLKFGFGTVSVSGAP